MKELSIERIVKFIQEGNPQWSVRKKNVGYFQSAVFKFYANIKEIGLLKKENIQVKHERQSKHQNKKLKAI